MSKVFVISIIQESGETDINVYSTFQQALKKYLKFCINEIYLDYLNDDDDSVASGSKEILDSEEDYTGATCILRVYELDEEKGEYDPTYVFDIYSFQEFIDPIEDVLDFLNMLEESMDNDTIPKPVLEAFQISTHQTLKHS